MAFGFSPKFEKEFLLEELTQQEFLVIAVEAAKELGWNIGTTNESGFIAYSGFSMRSYGEEIKVSINGNTVNIKSECLSNQLFDYGKNKSNVEDLITACKHIKPNFTKEELQYKFEELKQKLAIETILNEGALETKSKTSNFLSIFVPTDGYFVTPILININIAIFIIMAITGVSVLEPTGEDLLKWGANFRPFTLNYGWWRLLTCCFLHIGIFHLLMNMYALLYIGVLLESLLGRARFLAAYLVTGIAASLTSLLWHDNTISAGASGAIFGMYGVFLAMLTTNLIEKAARQSMLVNISIFVGYNLLYGVKGGIDNAAHIGGLLSGMLVGYTFYPNLKNSDSQITKNGSIILVSITIFVAALLICSTTNNDIVTYEERMKEFVTLEEEALMVYHLSDTTSNASVLRIIKNPGMSNWKKCVNLLEEIKKLDLPYEIKERNKLLKFYCGLRIESFRRMHELIKDSTKRVDADIELQKINMKIEKTIQNIEKISE